MNDTEGPFDARCQESKYVRAGRWGEWRACDKPGKHTIIATKAGSGFKVGDTIHVCGTHKRVHEQAVVRSERYRRDREESNEALAAARDRIRRLGMGREIYDREALKYTGGVRLTAEEVDRLLSELGR